MQNDEKHAQINTHEDYIIEKNWNYELTWQYQHR